MTSIIGWDLTINLSSSLALHFSLVIYSRLWYNVLNHHSFLSPPNYFPPLSPHISRYVLISTHLVLKPEYFRISWSIPWSPMSRGRLNIQMSFYQYMDPHFKDKTVSRLILNMGIPPWKDGLYIETVALDLYVVTPSKQWYLIYKINRALSATRTDFVCNPYQSIVKWLKMEI